MFKNTEHSSIDYITPVVVAVIIAVVMTVERMIPVEQYVQVGPSIYHCVKEDTALSDNLPQCTLYMRRDH